MSQLSRNDAAEGVYLQGQLDYILPKSFDIKRGEFKARQFIPVNNQVPSGAETVSYNTYDHVGMAKIVASYAKDFPRADIATARYTATIKSLGASFAYTLQEIRAAQLAGSNLEQRRANAARSDIAKLEDEIAAVGSAEYGLKGLLNVSNALSYTVPNGAGGTATWATKTGLEIFADLNAMAQYGVTQTNELEKPDTLLLPPAQFGRASTTLLQAGSTQTVMQAFLANSPYIKNVDSWSRLTGAGAGSTDRAVVYRRDPDALELIISQEFETFPAQQDVLEFKVPCHERCGGVLVYFPLSITYADGI
jgi:hypothetical protein